MKRKTRNSHTGPKSGEEDFGNPKSEKNINIPTVGSPRQYLNNDMQNSHQQHAKNNYLPVPKKKSPPPNSGINISYQKRYQIKQMSENLGKPGHNNKGIFHNQNDSISNNNQESDQSNHNNNKPSHRKNYNN